MHRDLAHSILEFAATVTTHKMDCRTLDRWVGELRRFDIGEVNKTLRRLSSSDRMPTLGAVMRAVALDQAAARPEPGACELGCVGGVLSVKNSSGGQCAVACDCDAGKQRQAALGSTSIRSLVAAGYAVSKPLRVALQF